MQWVLWYEEFVVKSGVHAAAYQACAPQIRQPQAEVLCKENVDA